MMASISRWRSAGSSLGYIRTPGEVVVLTTGVVGMWRRTTGAAGRTVAWPVCPNVEKVPRWWSRLQDSHSLGEERDGLAALAYPSDWARRVLTGIVGDSLVTYVRAILDTRSGEIEQRGPG
jgi:hypothetical protein